MTTDERLEKVEGQLARVRWFNRCLLGCIVLSLGVWLILKTFGSETAWAQSGTKVLQANKFVLEDENGKQRATLSVDKLGPALRLFDENANVRVWLAIGDGPFLSLRDENGKNRTGLGVGKDGPRLALYDENNGCRVWLRTDKDGAGLTLHDENSTKCGDLAVLMDGPRLMLTDGNGKTIWKAP